MKSTNALTTIRRIAISKANHLQRAHRYLDRLRPAFAEWAAGEVYVCKKTGSYRYRFGALSKAVTGWDAIAREVFGCPEAFAFAAMVLGARKPLALPERSSTDENNQPVKAGAPSKRANVVALAA